MFLIEWLTSIWGISFAIMFFIVCVHIHIKRTWNEIEGTVVKIDPLDNSIHKDYKYSLLAVEYVVDSKVYREFIRDRKTLFSPRPIVGERVKIMYNPKNPYKSTLEISTFKLIVIFFIGMLLLYAYINWIG